MSRPSPYAYPGTPDVASSPHGASPSYFGNEKKGLSKHSATLDGPLEMGGVGETHSVNSDDEELAKLGYKSEFRREFTNLSTISFAFSIMGLLSSITTTFDTPMLLGGPASVIWCWLIGSVMCFALGTSIAEIVSAYPTSGGLYSASAYLVPRKYRPTVGWLVGWLNLLGQVAGVASTEFGLSRMIWAAVVVAKDGNYEVTQAQTVGLFIGLLVIHGLINSLGTKYLATITQSFVFFNLGGTLVVIILLLAMTGEKNSAEYTFTNINNQSGWGSDGFAFLLGLLSVQWTMTDYDATAHISEEVKRASYAAPVAIFVAVIGTGIVGWLYNIILVLCSPAIENLPGPSGLSVATILDMQLGKKGFFAVWWCICATAFFVVTTAIQANSRSFFAFSRDKGLPDRGLFGLMAPNKVPIWSVWLVVFLSVILGCLDFASPIAANAVFSLTTVALDTSYAIPIFCKILFRNHPEVNFKPGPFTLGDGWFALFVNGTAVAWVAFVTVILSMPTVVPVDASNMNYAAPITGLVLLLSGLWYIVHARKFYFGPRSNLSESEIKDIDSASGKGEEGETSSEGH